MLYGVKVETKDYASAEWLLVVASSEAEAKSFCEDAVSFVVEITDDIEGLVKSEYEGMALICTH